MKDRSQAVNLLTQDLGISHELASFVWEIESEETDGDAVTKEGKDPFIRFAPSKKGDGLSDRVSSLVAKIDAILETRSMSGGGNGRG